MCSKQLAARKSKNQYHRIVMGYSALVVLVCFAITPPIGIVTVPRNGGARWHVSAAASFLAGLVAREVCGEHREERAALDDGPVVDDLRKQDLGWKRSRTKWSQARIRPQTCRGSLSAVSKPKNIYLARRCPCFPVVIAC